MRCKLLISAILCVAAAQAQTVDFTYTTTTGTFCSPQTVTFTQNCTGNPGGFIWSFGNGQSNTHATETVQYNSPGTYNVRLTALYADSAIVKNKTITINPTPSLTLTADKRSICMPGNIIFTATGSSFLSSWQWDFGDGSAPQTTGSNSISHNYIAYGHYTALVKGSSAAGCFTTDTLSVDVKRFDFTFADLTPPNGCIPTNVFLAVTTNIPAGDHAQSYLWDFGDGSAPLPGTVSHANHTYTTTTPAIPSVTVTSAQGCVSSIEFPTVAYGIPPTSVHAATASLRDTFCGSEIIDLLALSPDADAYLWHYGDNSSSLVSASLSNYKYSDTGHMHLVVTAMFHGCPGAKDSFDIYIKGVVANMRLGNTCAAKNVFNILNTSPGHVTHHEWTFSDVPGIIDSVNFNVSHPFPVSGIFNVKILVKDSITGCKDSVERVVYTAQPTISISRNPVCKDSLVIYTVSNTYPPVAGVKYLFVVDGQNIDDSTDSVLHHFPVNHGTSQDYVVIQHNNSFICDDTLHLPAPTRVTGPVTDFTVSPQRVCQKLPVFFTNNTHPFYPNDTIKRWQWDFWDGRTDTAKNPQPHIYHAPGEYIVSLTATDINGCALKNTFNVTVDSIPEITVYPRIDTLCLGRDTATLSAYTIYPFTWSPGTNISCANCDTIKAYPQVTTYYIATAINPGGCKNWDTSIVKVYAPFQVHSTFTDASVCPGGSLQLNVDHTGVTVWTPALYLNDSTIANPVSIPGGPVTYHVAVADSAGCYADTATVNVSLYPLPVVDAGPDRWLPFGTAFTLSPAYSPGSQIYSWSPVGDLECTDCPQPTGTITQTMLYKINVTSDKGCTSSDSVKLSLLCDKSKLFMPSAFTPEKIGVNDYFYPLAFGYKSIKTFIIYNRVGNKVFERKDFQPNIASLGWDGKIKGDNRGGTEAFVWYIEAVCDQGETVSLKGTVLLVK